MFASRVAASLSGDRTFAGSRSQTFCRLKAVLQTLRLYGRRVKRLDPAPAVVIDPGPFAKVLEPAHPLGAGKGIDGFSHGDYRCRRDGRKTSLSAGGFVAFPNFRHEAKGRRC